MDSIKKLAELFSRFPTIGPRTAGRFVFYLVNQPKEKVDELILALQDLQKNIHICPDCFNPFEGSANLCEICQNPARQKQTLCIVEKENDLLSLENTKKYQGLYFILGGTITANRPDGKHLRIPALQNRMKRSNISEVIIAINSTPEGRATATLVERALKELCPPLTFKITHLATGLPIGSELEYADEETLELALKDRK